MLPPLHGLSLDSGRKPVPTAASERPRPKWGQQLTASADRDEELQRLQEHNRRCEEALELARRVANAASNRAEVLQRQIEEMERSGPRASTEENKLQKARNDLAA